ncbi:MAG TPA: ferritin-like domain-containing protein [Gemmatimonadaceae bacterium]|nr:ferritin-like domain-containing protein [Gemmatimonadaceae bacterium]
MTTHNDDTILSAIDPELGARLIGRRDAAKASFHSVIGAGLALGSVPVALAALSKNAFGQSTPAAVTGVLNFALMLEIFENEFYKAVLGTSASAAQNAAFSTARSAAAAVPGAVPALQLIQRHEQQHVAFLLANGATNVLNLTATSFDFTGNRSAAGGGPFAAAGTNLPFLLAVAQGAEDTGVRAYKGQAGALQSNPVVLEAALRIHAVEARHAAKIRRMRRATGAPTQVRFSGYIQGGGVSAAGISNLTSVPAAATATFEAIYAGENNTTHGGVNTASLPNIPNDIDLASAATMAFDEPLTKAAVIAIVQPFFIPTIPA